MRNKTDQLFTKQNLEKNALKQKLDTEYEIMKKQKDDEMAVIILKFKNRKMDLESQQKHEKTLTENENLFKQSKKKVLFVFILLLFPLYLLFIFILFILIFPKITKDYFNNLYKFLNKFLTTNF